MLSEMDSVKESDITLRGSNITLNFGGVSALVDVNFQIFKQEILAIIGPNGAGKTSLLNCINGFYRPDEGSILFRGVDLTKTPSHKIARMGIARTFQNIELYTGLNTVHNLMAARHNFMKHGVFDGAFYFGRARSEIAKHRERVEDIIDFLDLAPIRNVEVGSLSYGNRKRVELGRALALEPQILLLDEPMAGMNVEEKEDMARFIIDILELKNTSIVMVEHDMGLIMDISDRIIVLDFGSKIAEGSPSEIMQNPEVLKAYLGTEP